MKSQQAQPKIKILFKNLSGIALLPVLLVIMLSTQSCEKLFDNKPCMDIRRESTVLTIAVNGEGNQVECIVNDGEQVIINGGDKENCPATIRIQGTAQVIITDAVNNFRLDTLIEAGGRSGIIYSSMERNAERCSCAP